MEKLLLTKFQLDGTHSVETISGLGVLSSPCDFLLKLKKKKSLSFNALTLKKVRDVYYERLIIFSWKFLLWFMQQKQNQGKKLLCG